MKYIGIDPGSTGALAIIGDDQQPRIYDFGTIEFSDALYYSTNGDCRALVEKVSSMPGQGVHSVFKFGHAAGMVEGMLQAYKIPYELITPGKWWRIVADSATKGPDKKLAALDLARRLYPEIASKYLRRKKDHNRAEALLIALACKIKSRGR